MAILDNAAQVLRCFNAEVTDLTVTDVVQRLDMPKANASRLLKAMREAGLIETIGGSRRHRPGRLLLDIAASFRASSVLIRRAGELVSRISRDSGHTGYVSVRDGREITGVLDYPGTNVLRVVSSIGRRLHAHASATGRTLLARLDDDAVRALYSDGLPQVSPLSPRTVDALLARLAEVRRDGFAYSAQESTPGVDSIAIAVGDPTTDELVSLCIVFPATVVDAAERAAILAALGEGAAEIARATGDTRFRALARDAKGQVA